jgi:hypothetical protein
MAGRLFEVLEEVRLIIVTKEFHLEFRDKIGRHIDDCAFSEFIPTRGCGNECSGYSVSMRGAVQRFRGRHDSINPQSDPTVRRNRPMSVARLAVILLNDVISRSFS